MKNSSEEKPLSAKSQELASVVQSVQRYNALPLTLRKNGFVSHSNVSPKFGCHEVLTPSFQWWGIQVYANDCAVATMLFDLGSVGAIAAFIASVCPPCLIVAGVIALYVALQGIYILWLDEKCGYHGVYLNAPWGLGVWAAPVC